MVVAFVPPSFNPSSSGRRKAVMQEGGEVPCPMAPCRRRQVFTPNDAHKVPFSGQPPEGVRQTPSGPDMRLVGGKNPRVAVLIERLAERFATLHPVEDHRFDEFGFRSLSGLCSMADHVDSA